MWRRFSTKKRWKICRCSIATSLPWFSPRRARSNWAGHTLPAKTLRAVCRPRSTDRLLPAPDFMLDGTDNRDPILGIIVINPTLESVTEAKMTSQNYEAEFGQAIAGVVASQTRSGSNSCTAAVLVSAAAMPPKPATRLARAIQANPVTGRIIPPSLYGQYRRDPSADRSSKTSCSSSGLSGHAFENRLFLPAVGASDLVRSTCGERGPA